MPRLLYAQGGRGRRPRLTAGARAIIAHAALVVQDEFRTAYDAATRGAERSCSTARMGRERVDVENNLSNCSTPSHYVANAARSSNRCRPHCDFFRRRRPATGVCSSERDFLCGGRRHRHPATDHLADGATLSFTSERGREGETAQVHLHLRNRGLLPAVALSLDGLGQPIENATWFFVPPLVSKTVCLDFVPLSRGVYPTRPIALTCGAPLGLWLARKAVAVEGEMLVWPLPAAVDSRLARDLRRMRSQRGWARSDDTGGVRPYRRGDEFRMLHHAQSRAARPTHRAGARTDWSAGNLHRVRYFHLTPIAILTLVRPGRANGGSAPWPGCVIISPRTPQQFALSLKVARLWPTRQTTGASWMRWPGCHRRGGQRSIAC